MHQLGISFMGWRQEFFMRQWCFSRLSLESQVLLRFSLDWKCLKQSVNLSKTARNRVLLDWIIFFVSQYVLFHRIMLPKSELHMLGCKKSICNTQYRMRKKSVPNKILRKSILLSECVICVRMIFFNRIITQKNANSAATPFRLVRDAYLIF